MRKIGLHEEILISYAEKEVTTGNDFQTFIDNDESHQNQFPKYGNNKQLKGNPISVYMHPFTPPSFGLSKVHYHTYFEMGYLFKGKAMSIHDGVKTKLREGDLFICNLQSSHQCQTFSKNDYLFNIMVLPKMFDNQFMEMMTGNSVFSSFFVNSILNVENPIPCMVFHTDVNHSLQWLLHKLIVEYLTVEPKDYQYLRLILASVFRELSRMREHSMDHKSRQEKEGLSIFQVLEYLKQEYATATLQSTANNFHYTTRFMTNYISKYTNQTFSEIMQEFKLQNTCEYLKKTNLSMDKIAELVGYYSGNYLNTVFKKKYNMTMKDYRNYIRSAQSFNL